MFWVVSLLIIAVKSGLTPPVPKESQRIKSYHLRLGYKGKKIVPRSNLVTGSSSLEEFHLISSD